MTAYPLLPRARRLCLSLFTLAAAAPAQSWAWNRVFPTAHPTGRQSPRLCPDVLPGELLLFGGIDNTTFPTVIYGDSWRWDGANWIMLTPPFAPMARYAQAMVHDPVRQRVVLFGGSPTNGGTGLNDTWEWDGASWMQQTPVASPGPRFAHAMTYDVARQVCVVFGGQSGVVRSSDIWEYDGVTWVSRSTPSSPPVRASHSMAYDVARQVTVVFGGYGGTSPGFLGDTWEWDGANWGLRAATSAIGNQVLTAMAYDAGLQRVVLSGGPPNAPQCDSWQWDGVSWTRFVMTTALAGRSGHAMAYDAARQCLVLFGGALAYDETWIAPTLGGVVASTAAYGAGCGAPALSIQDVPGTHPVIGTTYAAEVLNAPTGLAFMAWGLSAAFLGSLPLPMALAPFGVQGCFLHQSADLNLMAPCVGTGATTARHDLGVPLFVGLSGVRIYLQAWAPSPGFNPAGLITSNGLALTLGSY